MKNDARAREASAPGLADVSGASGFKRPPSARLQQRSIIKSDAVAELQEKQEHSGEPAAAFPDVLPDDTSDKTVIRPTSDIPAAGCEHLCGQAGH